MVVSPVISDFQALIRLSSTGGVPKPSEWTDMPDAQKRKKQTEEHDSALEGLDDQSLRARLLRNDWKDDSQYIKTEQVFRLFTRARISQNQERLGLLSDVLSRRLLVLAKGFASRSGIISGNSSNLEQAAEELSQFVWECLLSRPNDAEHAEKYFGQVFKRRALDFQRTFLAKKRKLQSSLEDAMAYSIDDDDPEKTIREVISLREHTTPDDALQAKQEYALVATRLQAILTAREYSVYVLLNIEEMKVKDVATALNVTTRTINNDKNSALDKIQKEFKK